MDNTQRQIQIIYLIAALLLGATTVTAQTNNTDTLHWRKDRKLTWDDFQGVPDTHSIGGGWYSIWVFY